MFNLDQTITEWRQQLVADGIISHKVQDELECHLRDDIRQQLRSGFNEQQAFEIAVQNMGQVGALKAEFSKLTSRAKARISKIVRISCFIAAALFALLSSHQYVVPGTNSSARLPGLAFIGMITVYLCSLPYLNTIFAAYKGGCVKISMEIVGTLVWLGSGMFILANMNSIETGAALWAMMPVVAVLVWIPRMIEYCAGSPPASGDQGPLPPRGGEPLQPWPVCPIPGIPPLPPEVHFQSPQTN